MPGPEAEDGAIVAAVLTELARSGMNAPAWLLGSARLIPSVLLIPAFGLAALPVLARVLFALVLAASVAPMSAPAVASELPWWLTLLRELVLGLPAAISAAAALWTASMAGTLIDELGGARSRFESPVTDSPAGPVGILLSLAASLAFLERGGPAHLTEALAPARLPAPPVLPDIVHGLVAGVHVAVLIAAPLLTLVLVLAVFQALFSRITSATPWAPIWAPLRALALLALLALLLDRLVEGLTSWMSSRLPPS